MTSRTYQVASGQLLRQARKELAGGDVRQASEKAWGAAAQIVKAIDDVELFVGKLEPLLNG